MMLVKRAGTAGVGAPRRDHCPAGAGPVGLGQAVCAGWACCAFWFGLGHAVWTWFGFGQAVCAGCALWFGLGQAVCACCGCRACCCCGAGLLPSPTLTVARGWAGARAIFGFGLGFAFGSGFGGWLSGTAATAPSPVSAACSGGG